MANMSASFCPLNVWKKSGNSRSRKIFFSLIQFQFDAGNFAISIEYYFYWGSGSSVPENRFASWITTHYRKVSEIQEQRPYVSNRQA